MDHGSSFRPREKVPNEIQQASIYIFFYLYRWVLQWFFDFL